MKKTLIMILLASALCASAQEKNLPPAFATMVATERAFAKLAGVRGVRDSFITFFADDGINFTPHPTKTRENLMSQPPPETLPPVLLNWTPVYGDIAAAGDLGYNTGPFVVEGKSPEKRPTRHGLFFSVWRKQKDGSWKVVLDMGAATPQAVAPLDAPFVAAPTSRVKLRGEVSAAEGHSQIMKIDQDFLATTASTQLGAAYANSLSETARMYRAGDMPLVGRKAIVASLANSAQTISGEPIDGGMSRSGDLGYVYGRYELKGRQPGDASEKGYYSRVWKIDASGKWRIVMDVTNPLPTR